MTRSCLAGLVCLAACSGGGDADWTLVGESTASWMAVWGTSPDDVWIVGGRRELAGAPQVAHYDGDRWDAIEVGRSGFDLWWVFGVPGSAAAYFGGSNGVILRRDGAAFQEMPTPSATAIVFGIWGASDTDLWAVGSDNGAGFAWRGDGATWTAVPLPAGVTGRLFKVHGQAADDVWISGAAGVTLHWDGSALATAPTGTPSSLFSIVTTPTRAVAVGGTTGEGVIFERDGAAWRQVPVTNVAAWRGVAAAGDALYVVGESGTVAHLEGTRWVTSQANVQQNFHAAWIDRDGGVWGVGGAFDRVPLTSGGFVSYFGPDSPRSLP